jgi:hypothetical protein
VEQAELIAPDGAADDKFGHSIAFSGDTVVVGAPWDDDAGESSGAAYVFLRSEDSWIQETKLTADDAAAEDGFGRSVSIQGNTIVVGAWGNDEFGTDAGAAYVFVQKEGFWEQDAKLTANDGEAGDSFGTAVSIKGNTILVGASFDDDMAEGAGAAYIFVKKGRTWIQDEKLTASDGSEYAKFGNFATINENIILIGASNDNGAGAAYVFVQNKGAWTQEVKLVADDGDVGDKFSYALSSTGNLVVIGAYGNDEFGTDAGAVYVFVRKAKVWSQQAKLTASDAAAHDNFGYSACVHGDTIVIGARQCDDVASDAGAVYVFQRHGDAWLEEAKLTASNGQAGDSFGFSVCLRGGTLVVGAHYAGPGSVYVFER